jgi:hypothetical protein
MHFYQFKPKKSKLIEALQLDELRISPATLNKFGASATVADMIGGFEAEVCFRNANEYNSPEEDMDQDERIRRGTDISDVKDFFSETTPDRDFRGLENDFQEWVSEKISEEVSELAAKKEPEIQQRMADEHNEDLEEEDWLTPEDFEQEAREEAYEEAYSEVEDNDWFDFYGFCQDKGFDWMSELGNEYGFGWPHYTDSDNEWNQAAADKIALSLKNHTGMNAEANESYHGGRRANTYMLEPDSSISPDSSDDMGVEIVSPPIPFNNMMEQLEDVLSWIRNRDGYTNESTGLHINLSIPGKEIDYVKLVLFSGDEKVLSDFDRLSNQFCAAAIKKVRNKATDITGSDEYSASKINMMLALLKQANYKAASQAIMKSNEGKYVSINFHTYEQYVEFRSMGGDYVDRWPEIRNNVLRFAQALSIACDPEAYKKEYANKLYKLLTSATANTELYDQVMQDSIKGFAMLQSGLMNPVTLKNILKNRAVNRQLQKNNNITPDKPNLPK